MPPGTCDHVYTGDSCISRPIKIIAYGIPATVIFYSDKVTKDILIAFNLIPITYDVKNERVKDEDC
jgi:hypothetical protein